MAGQASRTLLIYQLLH